MPAQKNILVCPLNWGLGHATRCVPIIKQLIVAGNKVIVAADGPALSFLQQELPGLIFMRLKGFNVRYFPKPFMQLGLFLQMPLLAISWLSEHYRLKKFIESYKIQEIISDNRYGVWHRKVKSVLITHQLYIQLPGYLCFLQKPLHWFTFRLIKPFNEVWVPDYSDEKLSLAGKLSHPAPGTIQHKYIGPLSRFSQMNEIQPLPVEIPDVLVLLSGPGKQKERLEKKLINILKNQTKKILIIGGKPETSYSFQLNNIKQINHLSTNELGYLLLHCPKIIARAGYSTIMDLIVLNRTALLIPTPGQWEQEYLANNEILNKRFTFIAERDLSKTAIELFLNKN